MAQQFGMQMPAGARKRGGGPNVYTAMAVFACVVLAAACVVMFIFAGRVGKGGNAFALQERGNIQLPAQK